MNRIETVLHGKKGNEKVLIITKISCSVFIIILALMQLIGIWDKAIDIFEPLLGILMIIQAIESWKKNRRLAIFSLCAALFVFVCVIVIIVNKIFNS